MTKTTKTSSMWELATRSRSSLFRFRFNLNALSLIAGAMLFAFEDVCLAEDVYQKPSAFIAGVFGGKTPRGGAISLTKTHQADIKRLIGRPYGSQRVRYWSDGKRTAWILNEIGKTKPITTGYVVSGGKIESVKVLIYRESHGWEVRQTFFTKQFKGAALKSGKLTKRVDNIAGATLSTRALTKMAKLALYLDSKK